MGRWVTCWQDAGKMLGRTRRASKSEDYNVPRCKLLSASAKKTCLTTTGPELNDIYSKALSLLDHAREKLSVATVLISD